MRLTPEEFAALRQRDVSKQPVYRPGVEKTILGHPVAKKDTKCTTDKMNSTETRYANLLELKKRAGEIADYTFAPDKLILTVSRPGLRAMTYTPDFRVIPLCPDDKIEYHEVKGFRREDWLVKWKVAIAMYPQYVFVLCQYKNGQWKITRYE